MHDPAYRTLVALAAALTVAWGAWAAYDGFLREVPPGTYSYHAGNRAFEDGDYERALREYEAALRADPGNIHALRGRARALLQLGRHAEALAAFDEAIRRDPSTGATYANRGILLDRMGRHREALADYERALELDPRLAEGPDWLTRFLRNQAERPPTIADRARYLREQLALPEERRLLRVPELDAGQRPYTL